MKILPAVAILLPIGVFAAQPAPSAQAEIDHLLSYIAHSDCRFYRNGSWHGMDEARAHVSTKYEWLRDHGEVSTAEDFIEGAASRSSLSGKNYRVQCPGAAEQSTGPWLKAELGRFRASPSGS
jgi:hypothetical protein